MVIRIVVFYLKVRSTIKLLSLKLGQYIFNIVSLTLVIDPMSAILYSVPIRLIPSYVRLGLYNLRARKLLFVNHTHFVTNFSRTIIKEYLEAVKKKDCP